ncbi:MAG: M56 family metallopeptidase [Chryseolinea sp.]
MNTFLNYLIEANLGLCILMGFYVLVLSRETDFDIKRLYLLMSVVLSILVPFLHFNPSTNLPHFATILPSLSDILPTQWLPEVVILGDGTSSANTPGTPISAWFVIDIAYTAGLIASLALFMGGIFSLLKLFSKSTGVRSGNFVILESDENKSSFSFFRYIYIGQADALSPEEKALIVRHEQIHATRLHSLDILLINIVGIFFWFNPILRTYKKTFIQLHEFEADARTVESSDADDYCSLLAKVALLSADYKLANHFSNSLTVKRIDMIRKLKSHIRPWKFAAVAVTLPCLFFVIACQDQVEGITEIARNSTNALIVPEPVQARFEQLQKENPDAKYLLVELNEKAETLLGKMQKDHGLPKSLELFTPDQGTYKAEPTMSGSSDAGVIFEKIASNMDLHTFAIIKYDATAAMISAHSKDANNIYTVVDTQAEYPGGIDALVSYLQDNVKYPTVARTAGVQGTSFISFVVNKDGSLSDFQVVKGVSPEIDKEALRVVSNFPNWTPGKQQGEIVRSRFVIPVKFKLGS